MAKRVNRRTVSGKLPLPRSQESQNQMRELLSLEEPPYDFRDVNLIPTVRDLFSKDTFVRPNLIHGAFASVNDYLDTQFHLLREDFFSPMREGIEEYMRNSESQKSKFGSIRIYRNVILCGPKVAGDRVGIAVNFDSREVLGDVNWKHTKRFMHGSLLCFTKNNFRTVVFGTVIQILPESRLVVVKFDVGPENNDLLLKDKDEYIMAESEVYFEPYYQVLKALRDLNEQEFPMKRYIVEAQRKSLSPLYLKREAKFANVLYSMKPNLKINIFGNTWPRAQDMGLDESQYKAFKLALTKDLAVIQGPPGTGKTFIGLKIAEVLIENCKFWNQDNQPILVVCYTNHALDQFLEGILNYTRCIVRVGGRSKSEEIKQYGLITWRREYAKTDMKIGKLQKSNHKIQCRLTAILITMKRIQHDMDLIQSNEGIVSLSSLVSQQVVAEYHHQAFECRGKVCEADFFEWLVPLQLLETCSVDSKPEVPENNTSEESTEVDEENDVLSDDPGNREIEDDEIHLEEELIVKVYGKLKYSKTLAEFHSKKSSLIAKINAVRLGESREYYKIMPELEEDYRQVVLTIKCLEKYLKDQRLAKQAHIDRLRATVDIWTLSYEDRWILYRSWLSDLREILMKAFKNEEKEFRYCANEYAETRQLIDLEIMQKCLVVGMTTTGAARQQPLLKMLKPRIVIVEEAAEVLESHIVASLTTHCEQLILIGDHKQLRPSTSVHRLAKYFKLDVSLFERMLNNGMHCEVLKVQHRMRPEIAALISPSIYAQLENHSSVKSFENIKGISKNVFFIDHNFPEKQSGDCFSYINVQEAVYLIALSRYLVIQGYEPQKITILSTYTAQMLFMRNEKQKYSQLEGIHITVVDNFQGEENDIILLSLVRNNDESIIGFLNTDNRICVALSRARKGMYIMGNSQILANSSGTWMKILAVLRKRKAIGRALEVRCQVHRQTKMQIHMSADFVKFLEAGCSLPCGTVLDCGHYCQAVCHLLDRKHEKLKCLQLCERVCALGHSTCKKRCYEECDPCKETVIQQLPCGHLISKICHTDIKHINCLVTVAKKLPGCGHPVQMPCCTDPNNHRCPYSCDARLDCGHICPLACHVQRHPDHLNVVCRQPCIRKKRQCSRMHRCTRICFEPCETCEEQVWKIIPACGHKKELPCSMNAATVYCDKTCNKMLECGHRCKNKCYEDCNECCKNVFKSRPFYGHTSSTSLVLKPEEIQKALESEIILNIQKNVCNSEWKERLPHRTTPQYDMYHTPYEVPLHYHPRCMSMNEGMYNQFFAAKVALPPWNEIVQVPLCTNNHLPKAYTFNPEEPAMSLDFSEARCLEVLGCGHPCEGSNKDCWQGRIHVPCTRKCDRVLICGHKCNFPCAYSCPPCMKNCLMRCKHKTCDGRCGDPCTPCREPCGWVCEHYQCTKMCFETCDRPPCSEPCKKLIEKCQHPCIGFCGEPCPPLCKICDKELFRKVIYGCEEEEDARFVYLEDCQHIVEARYLEICVNLASYETGDVVIQMPACPLCKTPISRNVRYSSVIKDQYAAVCGVKHKLFGELVHMDRNRMANIHFLKSIIVHTPGPFTAFSRGIHLFDSEFFKPYVHHLIQSYESTTQENTRNVFNFIDMKNLSIRAEIIKQMVEKAAQVTEYLTKENQWIMRKQIDFIFKVLMFRQRHLSIQEVHELNLEIQRFYRIVDMCIQQSRVNYQFLTFQQLNTYTRTVEEPLKSVKYSLAVDFAVAMSQAKMNELLNISDLEERVSRDSIFLTVGMRSQFWLKCPNGHYSEYHPTELGKCTQCCAEGGVSQRLWETHGHLEEAAGTTESAWWWS